MQIYDLKELLEKAYCNGFTVESISKATGVSAELIEKYYDGLHMEKMEIMELDSVMYLLMELYCEDAAENEYIRGIVQTLDCFYKISNKTIANYLDISIEEFEELLQNPCNNEKYFRKSLKILHLFMSIVREKQ